MKRIFTWIAFGVLILGAAACNQKAEFEARLAEQDAKIKNLTSEVNNLKDAFNALKDAQVNGYFILDVEEIKDADAVVGWRIKISNGETLILMNGKDGKDGKDGQDGGEGGGESGGGESGGGTPVNVSVEELADGWKITVGEESITIPKAPEDVVFSIKFAGDSYGAVAGQTVSYPFTITGLADGDELTVAAYASEGWTAVVKPDNTAVDVTAPDPLVNGQVIVFAANGKGKADMKVISFTGVEVSVAPGYQEAPASKEGDTVSVSVTTNVSYDIVIPVDWIHYDPTKGWTDQLTFTIDPNPGMARNATVRLVAGEVTILNIPIAQAGGSEYNAAISVGGNTAGLVVTVGEVSGDFAYLKCAVAATVEEALDIIDNGNGVTVTPGNSSTPLVPPVTGDNKVTFRVYNSTDTPIDYNYFTRKGLSAEDKEKYCGTYEFTMLKALTLNNRSNWVDLTASNPTYVSNGYDDAHIVIAPSTDIMNCLYEIPDFLGFGYEGCGNKSITEEVLIPNTWGLVDFSTVSAPSAPMKAYIYVAANEQLTLQIDGSTELFTIGDTKYYLTRDNQPTSSAVYFDFGVDSNDGALTLTDGSGYYSLVIASEAQAAVLEEAQVEDSSKTYRGDTSTVLFRGGQDGYADRPVLKKKAE